MKTLILDSNQIVEKVNRLAYQIYEANYKEDSVVLVGIMPNGAALVNMLAAKLSEIGAPKVAAVEMQVDKANPLNAVSLNVSTDGLTDKSVIVIDDVLNSGKTMIYGIKYLLDFPIKKMKTLALIDRDHKSFPIHADYVGLSLSTNLQEHVEVVLQENNNAAYLL